MTRFASGCGLDQSKDISPASSALPEGAEIRMRCLPTSGLPRCACTVAGLQRQAAAATGKIPLPTLRTLALENILRVKGSLYVDEHRTLDSSIQYRPRNG
jgi:hypothetical protein